MTPRSIRSALPALAAGIALLAPEALLANGSSEPSQVPYAALTPADAFSGLYVGLGGLRADNGDDRVGITLPGGVVANAGLLANAGTAASLVVGYRYSVLQGGEGTPGTYLGLELDLQSGDISDTDSLAGVDSSSNVRNSVSVRAQLGVALRDDILVYGFYGLLRGKVDYAAQGNFGGTPIDIAGSFTGSGETYGIGIDYALTESWTIRGEISENNLGITELTGAGGEFTEATPAWRSVKLAAIYRF
jgi:outer membrane immunogenic protein